MNSAIAIISDFGLKDHYVGTVHGIIYDVAPEAKVIDVTHFVKPFDVVDGALKLKWSFRYFPTGTIFLCLVDPDPSAEPIIVTTENYFLVCPNNGIGSLMFEEEPPEAVHRITAEHYFVNKRRAGNFRSRDQLTPIAAELSRLQTASHLGEEMDLKQLKRFKLPALQPLGGNVYEAIVLDVDYFGNLILNATGEKGLPKTAEINGVKVEKVQESFKGVKRGELFISLNPENHVQIVAYMSNASKLLKATRGTKVKLYY